MSNLKEKIAEMTALAICGVIYIALFLCIFLVNASGIAFFNFFGYEIGVGNLSGIFTSLQMFVCILMVCVNYKNGYVLANIFMSFSLFSMGMQIVRNHNLASLPGVTTMVISLIATWIIHVHFRLREKDAVTDYLTGLNNRRGLLQHLKRKSRKSNPFSLLYIDLDGFKYINDSTSHKVGDIVLCEVAKRLSHVVGKQGVVGRIGGDEFVIILRNGDSKEQIARKIIENVSREIDISMENNRSGFFVTASIGIASYPTDSTDVDELVKLADIAMYEAKKSGKNKYICYNEAISDESIRQAKYEKTIKEGLERDLFYLVFQPQYKSESHELRGFETLLRLKDEEGNMISPADFIPVAEKSDLILQIDNYVLRKAMSTFKDIILKMTGKCIISVNVSAKNIGNQNFAQKVEAILNETGFPAGNLEIEITEYCFVQSMDVTVENINKLKKMGVRIALDDFGTGYASLSYLSNLPIDLLKIDKSFIDHIETEKVSYDFITAVISMGHILGCEVISEGVETEEQIHLLFKQSCDYIQGYVWGKPMEFAEAEKLCNI